LSDGETKAAGKTVAVDVAEGVGETVFDEVVEAVVVVSEPKMELANRPISEAVVFVGFCVVVVVVSLVAGFGLEDKGKEAGFTFCPSKKGLNLLMLMVMVISELFFHLQRTKSF